MDGDGTPYFIEGNTTPGLHPQTGRALKARLARDVFTTALNAQAAPEAFARLKAGDVYAGFEVLYNEAERGAPPYDPCAELA